MDRLPIELLSSIATYACIDGGRTGCSLSLVSRYVRAATRRVRYQSVALLQRSSIIAFSRVVQTSSDCPSLSHLFIAASAPTDFEEAGGTTTDDDLEEHEGDLITLEGHVIAIVCGASHTLQTLFIDIPRPLVYIHRILAFPFPHVLTFP